MAGLLAAQDPPSRAGRISYLSGAVSFDPAGVDQWVPATVNRPLTVGDQLYSDNGARAEVHVPGAAFRLGDRAAFEFMNLDDQTVQARLSSGPLDVRVRNLYGNVEIDTPNAAFTITRPGDYRLDTNPDNGQTYITVRDGEGQVTSAGGAFAVQRGQQAAITGQGPSAQYQINGIPGNDAFDSWALSREQREDRYANSRYVSPAMVGYEDLGEYGTWRPAEGYGDVWVPNSMPAGWAPYQDGHWAWVDPWGWTWVDEAPWGFAPFHYGRWAYINNSWGWCPGPVAATPVYAPALVAWVGFGAGIGVSFGGGPGVGWFPLGPRDVYVPAFTASAAYVTRINVSNTTVINRTNITNVYNTYERTGAIPVNTYMNRTVPGAVMAVPQNALTEARPVRQIATRLKPTQLGSINAGVAAPRVAPQVASVLGRAPGGSAPRPPAAVLSRPVVAKIAPPQAPPSFQQRQAVLAKNPGRPVPVAQLHQLAAAARPAAGVRPQVTVVKSARPITPHVTTAQAPKAAPATPQRTANAPAPKNVPAPKNAPPAAQPRTANAPAPKNVPAPRNAPPAAQPRSANVQRPSYLPPSAQPHTAKPPQQQAQHPAPPAREQPRVPPASHAAAPPARQNPQLHASAPAPRTTVPPPAKRPPAREQTPAPPPRHAANPAPRATTPPPHVAAAQPRSPNPPPRQETEPRHSPPPRVSPPPAPAMHAPPPAPRAPEKEKKPPERQ